MGPPDLNAFGSDGNTVSGLLAALEHVPTDGVAEFVLGQLTDEPPLSGQDLADAIHEYLGISLGADAAAAFLAEPAGTDAGAGLPIDDQTAGGGPIITQTPEPATLSLLAIGTLALLRRRKK